MIEKYAIIRFAVVISVILAVRSEGRELIMTEALEMARAHSHTLKRAEALRDASSATLSANRADRMPTFSAEAVGSVKDEVASLTLEPAPGVIIHRELGTKDVFQTDLRLSLPLYTGGRLGSAIEFAHADQRIQEALVRASENEVIFTTQIEYLSLFMADTLLASAEAALDRATIVRSDIQSMYGAGTADSVDLLEAQLALAGAQLGVDEAITRRRQSEIRLNLLLGLAPGESLELGDQFAPPRRDDVKVILIRQDKAEIEAARYTAERYQKERSLARSRSLPSVTAFGGYSYGKPNQDMFNKTWNDYVIAGAKLSWSVNLGFSDSKRVRAASARARSAEIERNRVVEQVAREVSVAYESLVLAYKQFDNAQQRRQIATDNYRLARMRQQEGTIPTNRLLEIEKSLAQAEAALAANLAQFYIARAAYYYATGSDELKRGL